MSDKPVRVGIVGAGANTTARHIPGLQAIDGVEIVSVSNRSRASSERAAQRFGISTVYDTWQELVAAPDTNAIVIGTWPYLHCRVTLAALATNKHVLCEARMAMNATEARSMRAAAQSRPHLVAQLVPSPVTLRVDATVQRLIAEGFLGDILVVRVRDGSSFVNPDAQLGWRQDADLSGVNVLSLGIWYEALLRWVGEATRVMAMGKTFVRMRKDGNGRMRAVRVPEHVDVVADLACGAQAHFGISSVTGLAGPSDISLFGSAGTLRFSGNILSGGQRDATALEEIPIPDDQAGHWRVEEEFVNAIRGREPVTHTTFDDGVKYMDFTEAVARSMVEARAVSLPLS